MRIHVAAAVAFALAIVLSAVGASGQRPAPVVLISIDGMRWDYCDLHPDETPTLRKMKREGASARGLIPMFPSNTFPNHYTIVTGLYPAHHGILNNQMFDPGDGAKFTFVKNPVADFLAGAPNGLDQNEADDADNIQYTGGTIETNSAFVRISQIQGNSAATMRITALDIADSPQGRDLISAAGSPVAITAIRVFNASGQPVAPRFATHGAALLLLCHRARRWRHAGRSQGPAHGVRAAAGPGHGDVAGGAARGL